MQHDSRNERFENMRKGTFKYPDNRFGGYLPKRIPEPSEPRLSDNLVKYRFNDFIMYVLAAVLAVQAALLLVFRLALGRVM